MVEDIYAIKNEIIGEVVKDMREKGAGRIDPQMVDMIKDLAEAEEKCWKAEYYRAVTEAMESRGYMPEETRGYDGMSRRGYRDSMGRYAKRGYHDEIEGVRRAMGTATADEREKMKRELRQMVDSM